MSYTIGIDVSKDRLDCAGRSDLNQVKTTRHHSTNTPKGFSSLLIWAKKIAGQCAKDLTFIIEPTSIYHDKLVATRRLAAIYGAKRLVATELSFIRYDKIVEAMGGHGEYCERPEEIAPALERAFASGKPALVNVVIRQDIKPGMKGSTYT